MLTPSLTPKAKGFGILPRRWLILALLSIFILGQATGEPSHPLSRYLIYGIPVAKGKDSEFKVLSNTGYEVGYSEKREDPLWAAYHMSKTMRQYHDDRPIMKFASDSRINAKVTHNDYSEVSKKYDRGHTAPNHAIDKFYGATAQRETFIMSNICPQTKYLNEQTWRELESNIADHLVDKFGELWVYAGPVFDDDPDKLRSGIQIPESFFYIILRLNHGDPEILCVRMDQDVKGFHELRKYLVSLEDLEDDTAIDFFPQLTAAQQRDAQKRVKLSDWEVDTVYKPAPERSTAKNTSGKNVKASSDTKEMRRRSE